MIQLLKNYQLFSENTSTEKYLAALALFFFTFYFHGEILNAFWRLHDGKLILFALNFDPLDYFFNPAAIASQSSHLTPWNIFFYEINLFLFGLNPRWHYAHMLLLLWISSVLTYLLLRTKVTSLYALFGALIFLTGLSTVESTRELMSGHYLTGLVFCQLAILFYLLSIKKDNNQTYAVTGAFFYLLSTACKEIYVPLIIVLPFINHRPNLKTLRPYIVVALLYILWRFVSIESFIGGYTPNLSGLNIIQIVKELASIPGILLGTGGFSYITLAVVGYLFILSLIQKKLSPLLFFSSAIALLVPLVPLTLYPGIDSGNNRYFYLIWWGFSVFIAFLLNNSVTSRNRYEKPVTLLFGLFLLISTAIHAENYKKQYLDTFMAFGEKHYQFLLDHEKNNDDQPVLLLLEGKLIKYWKNVLYSFVRACNLSGMQLDKSVKLVDTAELFEFKRQNPGLDVYQYSPETRKIENVNALMSAKLRRFQKRYIKDVPLAIHLSIEGQELKWKFSPYQQGIYKIYYSNDQGQFKAVTANYEGQVRYSSAISKRFYVNYQSPQGWIAQTPELSFDSQKSNTFTWSGLSVLPFIPN